MRRSGFGVWLLLLAPCLCGQSPSASTQEKAALLTAKHLLVSSFDRGLPRVSLEFFLNYEADGAPVNWDATECDEAPPTSTIDRERDSQLCVRAEFDLDHRVGTVLVLVAASGDLASTASKLVGVRVKDLSGTTRSIQLSALPMEMHHPPERLPRDRDFHLAVSRSAPITSSE